MDYSQLSDFEINKHVARSEGVGGFHCENIGGGSALRFSNWKELDYCNNPSDAWPIIVDNKIKIEPVRRVRNYNEWYEEWDASVNSPHFCESHKNPLRAAMIVFLLSQDANHA